VNGGVALRSHRLRGVHGAQGNPQALGGGLHPAGHHQLGAPEVVREQGAADVEGLVVQVGQLDVGEQRAGDLVVEALELQGGVGVLVNDARHALVLQRQAPQQQEVGVVPEGEAEQGGGAQGLLGIAEDGVARRHTDGGLAVRQEDDQRDAAVAGGRRRPARVGGAAGRQGVDQLGGTQQRCVDVGPWCKRMNRENRNKEKEMYDIHPWSVLILYSFSYFVNFFYCLLHLFYFLYFLYFSVFFYCKYCKYSRCSGSDPSNSSCR